MANTTLIDELVIALSLDPKDFSKGQKEVANDLIKTRDQADSSAKQIEASGKRAANYFASLKNEVIGLGLALAGAKGLTDLASNMIDNAAAAGRLSANIGVSTERISAWQGAVKEMNGTADEANAALSAMSTAIGNYQLTRSTGNDAVFRALGVGLSDLNAGPEAMLMRIAGAGEHMDRRNYVNLLQRLGFGPGMIATLEQGRSGLERVLTQQQRMYTLTQRDAEQAERFQKAMADLSRTLQGDALPYLEMLGNTLDAISKGGDDAQKALDDMTKPLIAVAVVAALAGSPFIALAAAIGAVATQWNRLKSTWSGFDQWWDSLIKSSDQHAVLNHLRDLFGVHGAGQPTGAQEAYAQLFGGDSGGGTPSSPRGSAGRVSKDRLTNIVGALVARGIDPGTARGIGAGIIAEGGSLNAVNPASGAFGIGQWLGPRKDALFARYGPHPTATQQFDFLVNELRGGDRGGASVLASKDPQMALLAYIWNFMRPQGAHGEHIRDAIADTRRGRQALGMGAAAGSTVNLNGPITITTQAQDGRALVNGLPKAVNRRLMATPANSGVN